MFRLAVNGLFVLLAWHCTATAQGESSADSESTAIAYAEQGRNAWKEGNLQEAIDAYTLSLSISPNSENYFARAEVWLELNENEKVIADCTRSIELCGHNHAVHFLRGLARANLGNYELAISDFSKEVLLGSNHPAVYYHRGLASLETHDYQHANLDFTKVISKEPNSGAATLAYYYRGQANLSLEEYQQAISDFTQFITRAPESPREVQAYTARGHAHSELKNYDQAIADISKALDLHESSEVFVLRAQVRSELGQHQLAVSDFNRAIELEPNEPLWHMLRAIYWLTQSEFSRALKDAERAIALDPHDADYHILRGDCRSELECFADAIQDYERALEKDGNSTTAKSRLAKLLSECADAQFQDLERAAKIATSLCELTEWKDWKPMILLSSIEIKKGETKQALAIQQKALEVAPEEDIQFVKERIESIAKHHAEHQTELSRKREASIVK